MHKLVINMAHPITHSPLRVAVLAIKREGLGVGWGERRETLVTGHVCQFKIICLKIKICPSYLNHKAKRKD